MGTNSDLFSEVYGCYYSVVAKILEQAGDGISKSDIEKLVNSHAFYDSAFHLLPKLFSDEWSLLKRQADGKYYSKLQWPDTRRPMTGLEKAWLKALLLDRRILLFVAPDELAALKSALSDIPPLFLTEDFHTYDLAADGDPYEDETYIQNFRSILKACVTKSPVYIQYESGKQRRLARNIVPYHINYSVRDDKFRLLGVLLKGDGRHKKVTLNFARIRSVESSTAVLPVHFNAEKYFVQKTHATPIVLEISEERNALERFMLQFASWEKQTEYDEEKECYTCRIYYDRQDETELLIRILSFGPVVKVLGPEGFLTQIKERINRQYRLNIGENDF
ncbi:WYL domain-containing protein [Anaerocolumna xylanovorans]|uniref:Predicted DNA-binding transcriptional regulator YafY, contains an HTH and WYL domains n=1 Tax=Anaerocolumna xylanovorans DSM 12503 TaxID=1121345 RepID=A0A1M7Y9A1_9FIRM|nr:WYL domain-containing protein [Anaerocolumna xylanovorans]SHO49161.1 Predicted DNA-binding transcriptional regulator YafY, contains an HTH and WYL domains [Anaerocolumna xylanovorans DSM 12503]